MFNLSWTKEKEKGQNTGWRITDCLPSHNLACSSKYQINIPFYGCWNDSLSKWKTIDYLPKKIESPTYEKRSQRELNQVTLQRHNDSRVGISPPSEPDVRVSLHPALRRGISTSLHLDTVDLGSTASPNIHIMGVYRRSQRLGKYTNLTIVTIRLALAEIIT